MRPEPAAGFNASFESLVRAIRSRVTIFSHNILTNEFQNSFVTLDSSNHFAQRIVPSSAIDVKKVGFFISRVSGQGVNLTVRILADSGGLPDTGTVLGEAQIKGFITKRPVFVDSEFFTPVSLSSSTNYWFEIKVVGSSSFSLYKNNSATGFNYAKNDSTLVTDESLIVKVVSDTESQNEFELKRLFDLRTNITRKFGVSKASFTLDNENNLYDEDQPTFHILFTNDLKSAIYIGNKTDYMKIITMFFNNVIKLSDRVKVDLINIESRISNKRALMKSEYVGQDYAEVINDLLGQANISSSIANISKTFPSFGTLEGNILDAINTMGQGIGYVFKIDENGDPSFTAKSTTYTPVFTLDESKHILRQEFTLEESDKNIINHVIAHNGRTSDGQSISLDETALIANTTGTIPAATKKINVSISFPNRSLNSYITNKVTDGSVSIVETYRDSLHMRIDVFNNKFPDASVNYDFDLFGQKVKNVGPDLILSEKVSGGTYRVIRDIEVEVINSHFPDRTAVTTFSSETLLFNTYKRQFFDVETRGYPALEVGDIIKFNLSGVRSDFIFRVMESNTNYDATNGSYSVSYKVERFPFLEGTIPTIGQLFADSGLFADAGEFSDTVDVNNEEMYVLFV